ncbi:MULTISPECIES: GMC family oxidoreductase [unclassified Pseudomonas]|uniref:FAD-dependent oxidoreductase n=1 Tax=unclassified Pseudomonas TaxID=196821 RepID=UPI001AEAD581|nr:MULTISPECIES: GMC family oxidoreductase [unclassified Pseudomonas]MBP2272729.1 choline dehydrogenase-like flavoprotein [Pseudomonas sp. BP6]MBP2288300.1 choline dehydrogenase-like flavoprotein [Pseudomonas sp. BP7]HDS1699027.1 GMC family oxidoreductase [Pseudomonas putida]HDS1704161.1 GMC family oxidoreductase [Pseudomonas putida]
MSTEVLNTHSEQARLEGAPARRRSNPTVKPDENGVVTCDVLIIGSGMGGSTFAHALTKKGLDVLVVERGDFLPRETENWSAEAVFGEGRYRNAEQWLDRDNKPFSPGVFYYVGGNTKFYGAMLPRFREVDFSDVKHAEGVAPGWPISYAELEPYYCQAEQLYKVHGNAGQDPSEPWRSQPYPWPGLQHDPALLSLEKVMKDDGLSPFVMPAAVDYGEDRACVLCSTCDGYPCLLEAKGDAEISTLRPALESGARLMVGTKIDKLVTSKDGKRVTEALGVKDGQPVRILANRIALACGAVNSAALLFRSKNELHPTGLGNSSDQLGRNYMVHNSTFMIAVDPLHTNKVKFQKTLAINDWYSAGRHNTFPLGNVQMLGKIREPMITPMRPWIPKIVSRFITGHSVDLYLTSEDIPTQDNRVEYDEKRNSIKVHWTPNNLSAHDQLVEKTTAIMKKAGFPVVLTERMGIATNSHQCGTAVMGADPKKSVLDPNCKMHDLDNVWIVDSSSFPSSAAVNPALTIAANALRIADKF